MEPPTQIVVRRIAPTDGPLLRRMRLSAIADSPGEFTSTLQQAEAHDAHHWDAAADLNASGASHATFFAEADDQVIGMLGGYVMAAGVVNLVGLWSAPGYRDIGVAAALIDAMAEWAIRSGAVQLRLWVVERNEHSRRFYEGRGFTATGAMMPYELDPAIGEVEMSRELPALE